MTPLQFAARCALGMIHGIKVIIDEDAPYVHICLTVRNHWMSTVQAWERVYGLGTLFSEQYEVYNVAEWQDAILSALTEKHATATHIALPDGSVPMPDMHGWRFGGAVPVPDLGGVCAICGLFEKDIAHTSGREDACRFVDEASLIVADSRAIGDGSVPQVVTDARTEVHRV